MVARLVTVSFLLCIVVLEWLDLVAVVVVFCCLLQKMVLECIVYYGDEYFRMVVLAVGVIFLSAGDTWDLVSSV